MGGSSASTRRHPPARHGVQRAQQAAEPFGDGGRVLRSHACRDIEQGHTGQQLVREAARSGLDELDSRHR
jgi:hypothetical protein